MLQGRCRRRGDVILTCRGFGFFAGRNFVAHILELVDISHCPRSQASGFDQEFEYADGFFLVCPQNLWVDRTIAHLRSGSANEARTTCIPEVMTHADMLSVFIPGFFLFEEPWKHVSLRLAPRTGLSHTDNDSQILVTSVFPQLVVNRITQSRRFL